MHLAELISDFTMSDVLQCSVAMHRFYQNIDHEKLFLLKSMMPFSGICFFNSCMSNKYAILSYLETRSGKPIKLLEIQ